MRLLRSSAEGAQPHALQQHPAAATVENRFAGYFAPEQVSAVLGQWALAVAAYTA